MKTLLQWIGAMATALVALAIISPPVAAQLNRISPRQIVCGAGLMLSGGAAGVTCTGQALFGDGTVTAPSIARQAQPTTGLRFSANGNGSVEFCAAAYSGTNCAIRLSAGEGLTIGNGVDLAFTPSSGAAGTVDTRITRTGVGELGYTTVAFAALGTPADGTITPCTDCAPTTPASCPGTRASCVCTNSGSGSIAVRIGGSWLCPF